MSKTTVLYDGYCVLCQQTVRIIRRLDWLKRIETLDVHNKTVVEERYPTLEHEALMGEIHIVTNQQQVLVGFFAMRYIARYLPLLWLIFPFLYFPGINWLGPKIYGWIARRRYAINRFFGVPTCEDGYCKLH